MKRLFALILAVVLILSFAGCGDDAGSKTDMDPENEDSSQIENTQNEPSMPEEGGNKEPEDNADPNDEPDISMEDIVYSSVFSERLAIVCLREDMDTAYVINKQGKLQFTFPVIKADNFQGSDVRNLRFENGVFVYNGQCYRSNGTVISPEDVGATSFLMLYNGQYIIAERITSDYASSAKELGVLNLDLEWVVSPSEGYYELYNSFRDFFLKEVVVNKDASRKVTMNENSLEVVYFNDGTTLTTEEFGVDYFRGVYDSKYILVEGKDGLGIVNANLEWVVPQSSDFKNFYRNNSWQRLFYFQDTLIAADPNKDSMNYGVTYYDLLTGQSEFIPQSDLYDLYTKGDTVISMTEENDKVSLTYGPAQDISKIEFCTSQDGEYILVEVKKRGYCSKAK